jgi:hypothetical protein
LENFRKKSQIQNLQKHIQILAREKENKTENRKESTTKKKYKKELT